MLSALVAALALCALGHRARLERTHAPAELAFEAAEGGDGASAPTPRTRHDSTRTPATPGALAALREGRSIDLNRATATDLELLPGIGPSLARRIVDSRDAQGAFASLDELARVRGIGPRTLERLRRLLRVEPGAAGAAAPIMDPAARPRPP